MNDSEPPTPILPSPIPPSPIGPLHLQKHLSDCSEELSKTLRTSVEHPITLTRNLHCNCDPNTPTRLSRSGTQTTSNESSDSIQARTRTVRRSNIPTAHHTPVLPNSEVSDSERRVVCRFFSVQMNDEEGIVHANCRRCERLILLYDRALYWGIKRSSGDGKSTPQTFPYRCSCGGHMFEICMGFLYPEEALDENDLDTITIAVRCVSCNELAIIFDDEAT